MTARTISVVLPTYNRSAVVETTLRRLLAQDYPADAYEVLVCDNSSDDTPAMVERLASDAGERLRLLHSDERLPAVKRNQGLRAAHGQLVLFLNDDLWVGPGFLTAHADAHARHGDPVAVLGHVEQSPSMPQTPFISWYRPFAYHELEGRSGEHLSWRYSWSMNLSLPRDVMIERNLVFHEDWAHIGHEDVELGWRWTAAGLPLVYEPSATGEHYHPHELDSACALQASIGRGLRDLEALVDDPGLLERYGIFSWSNSPRAVARGLARRVLFNGVTVPRLQPWLARRERRSPVTDWMYWKVLLHHTNRAYREAPRRRPVPTPTLPERQPA